MREKFSRILVVGELNPYGVDLRLALYHLPRGASGDRLRKIMGLTDAVYARLTKVNLCLGRWSARSARERATEILADPAYDVLILVGVKVREAFSGPAFFDDCVVNFDTRGEKTLASLPHPSGRCREWNDPESVTKARDLLRAVAPHVPWGSADG